MPTASAGLPGAGRSGQRAAGDQQRRQRRPAARRGRGSGRAAATAAPARSSRPTRNSIITTPNSAKCITSCALGAEQPTGRTARSRRRRAGSRAPSPGRAAWRSARPAPRRRGRRRPGRAGSLVHAAPRRRVGQRVVERREAPRPRRGRAGRRAARRAAADSGRGLVSISSSFMRCVPWTTNGGRYVMPQRRAVCSSGASSSRMVKRL